MFEHFVYKDLLRPPFYWYLIDHKANASINSHKLNLKTLKIQTQHLQFDKGVGEISNLFDEKELCIPDNWTQISYQSEYINCKMGKSNNLNSQFKNRKKIT